MRKFAFTICAKNYIGLAQTLESSIRAQDSDVEFFIFVADEFSKEDNIGLLPSNIWIAKDVLDIPGDEWNEMSFKYDLTEFCTSIKPSCFKYLFGEYNPGSCIYFDPDIMVFNSLNPIYTLLDKYSIILTPHITSMESIYSGKLNEQSLLFSGMYNLGFIGLKNDKHSNKLIDWWHIRLKDRCFQNKMESYFTDQKWMDFLPSFFPSQLLVSSDLGLNVAPWNFHERKIIVKDDIFYVQSRIENDDKIIYPLTFLHFSGYNYKLLLKGEIVQQNLKDFDTSTDFEKVFSIYINCLVQGTFSNFIDLSYSYNYFSNKIYISNVYRKLFRRLLEDGKILSNPFDSEKGFYTSLKKSGLIKKNMINTDKSSIGNVSRAENKTLLINKIFRVFYKLIGVKKFFLIVRLMRLYSKIENHVYLIDESYLKNFKIRN